MSAEIAERTAKALIIMLEGPIRACELADRLRVPQRTADRTVRAIQAAGWKLKRTRRGPRVFLSLVT
jgi:predicted DNA-binding transcriptional regulator YafY